MRTLITIATTILLLLAYCNACNAQMGKASAHHSAGMGNSSASLSTGMGNASAHHSSGTGNTSAHLSTGMGNASAQHSGGMGNAPTRHSTGMGNAKHQTPVSVGQLMTNDFIHGLFEFGFNTTIDQAIKNGSIPNGAYTLSQVNSITQKNVKNGAVYTFNVLATNAVSSAAPTNVAPANANANATAPTNAAANANASSLTNATANASAAPGNGAANSNTSGTATANANAGTGTGTGMAAAPPGNTTVALAFIVRGQVEAYNWKVAP